MAEADNPGFHYLYPSARQLVIMINPFVFVAEHSCFRTIVNTIRKQNFVHHSFAVKIIWKPDNTEVLSFEVETEAGPVEV